MTRRCHTHAALFALSFAASASAAMSVSGSVTTTRWTRENSPYRVVDTITVPSGNTLTIEPGVDVLFDADVPFLVYGALHAVGTETDSIRFLKGTAREWQSIRLLDGASGQFRYVRVSESNSGELTEYIGAEPGNEGTGGAIAAIGEHTVLLLDHAVISENRAHGGGGLHISENAVAKITSSVIRDNDAVIAGGVSFSWGARATFDDCIIRNNRAQSNEGGGFVLWNSDTLVVQNSTIADNECDWGGGGFRLVGSPLILSHSVIAGNRASSYGGGLWFSDGSFGRIIQCTIVGNSGSDPNTPASGVGIHNSRVTIKNSIVWGNQPQSLVAMAGGSVTVRYSDVQDGWAGEGNINADPLFVNAAAGDHHLRPGSPCIDAGDPASPKDPDGTRADMGALPFRRELTGPRLVLPKLIAQPDSAVAITVRGTFENADGVDLAFLINRNVLAPRTPFVLENAFDGYPGSQTFTNIVGDTVFVTMATDQAVSLDDGVLLRLAFRVSAEAPLGTRVPLQWLAYPGTNVSEARVRLVNGEVLVQKRLFGDVSGDGTLSAFDASLILQYVVRLLPKIRADLADVSADGTISSHDAAYVMKKVLDPSLRFPVEGEGVQRPATSPRRTLAWDGQGSLWRLVIDDPTGVESGQMVLLLPSDGAVSVRGAGLLETNREERALRLAFVDLSPHSRALLSFAFAQPLAEPPRVTDIQLNEGEIPVERSLAPERFALAQNLPNPFNPMTTIRYTLPARERITLAVYDVNGRLIRTLVDASLPAGSHEAVWNGSDSAGRPVASGVYLCRLSSNGRSVVRKMVLVR